MFTELHGAFLMDDTALQWDFQIQIKKKQEAIAPRKEIGLFLYFDQPIFLISGLMALNLKLVIVSLIIHTSALWSALSIGLDS